MLFEIDDNLIAEASKSSALSPSDKESIEALITLSSRTGLQDLAKDLLVIKSSVIGSDIGRWNEELREWEKALELTLMLCRCSVQFTLIGADI